MIDLKDLLAAIEAKDEQEAVSCLNRYDAKVLADYKNEKGKGLLFLAIQKFLPTSTFMTELNKKIKLVAAEQKSKLDDVYESYRFVKAAANRAAMKAGRKNGTSMSECSCDEMPREEGLEDSPRNAMDELAIKWLTKTYPLSHPKNKVLKILFVGEGKLLYMANLIYKLNKLGYGIMACAHDANYVNFFADQLGIGSHFPGGLPADATYTHAIKECYEVIGDITKKFNLDNAFTFIFNNTQLKDPKNAPFDGCHAIFGVDIGQHLITSCPAVIDAMQNAKLHKDALVFMSTILNPKSILEPTSQGVVSKNAVANLFVTKPKHLLAKVSEMQSIPMLQGIVPGQDVMQGNIAVTELDSILISVPTGEKPKRIQVQNVQQVQTAQQAGPQSQPQPPAVQREVLKLESKQDRKDTVLVSAQATSPAPIIHSQSAIKAVAAVGAAIASQRNAQTSVQAAVSAAAQQVQPQQQPQLLQTQQQVQGQNSGTQIRKKKKRGRK